MTGSTPNAKTRLTFSPAMKRVVAGLVIVLGLLSVGSRVSFTLSRRGVTNDFTQDYVSARAWSDGLDPYTDTGKLIPRYFGANSAYYDIDPLGQGGTPHPPSMIVTVGALSWLPYKAARLIWLFAMAAAVAIAIGWFTRLIGASKGTAAVVGVGALAIPVVQTDLIYGQSNGVLLLLFVVAWWALEQRRDVLAGSALGISAAIKLFPALMVIPLLGMRRFKAALWLVVVSGVVTLVSGVTLGVGATKEFFRDVSPSNFRFWRAAPMNLSLLSVPFRWLTKSVWRPGSPDHQTSAYLLAAILFVVLIFLAYRGNARVTGDRFWEAIPFLLLATPIMWETYLVLVVPLTILVLGRLIDGNTVPSRLLLFVALAIAGVGLWPGLPPVLHASALAQITGFSWPMYALLAVVLLSAFGSSVAAAQIQTQGALTP